jgi:hypothetical protein
MYARLKLMPAVVSTAVKAVDAKRVAHIVADGITNYLTTILPPSFSRP